ncbi:hypothetical protein [Embleya sp. NBC_00896]|uniref:hypothetical protein n=1 Tax=Embleya sp. NBC_00896 TaxID=2975961 RepID=UPI0038686933|nr:hypothetical protein OG928_23620 [Embleya sp. NBC_00896]
MISSLAPFENHPDIMAEITSPRSFQVILPRPSEVAPDTPADDPGELFRQALEADGIFYSAILLETDPSSEESVSAWMTAALRASPSPDPTEAVTQIHATLRSEGLAVRAPTFLDLPCGPAVIAMDDEALASPDALPGGATLARLNAFVPVRGTRATIHFRMTTPNLVRSQDFVDVALVMLQTLRITGGRS